MIFHKIHKNVSAFHEFVQHVCLGWIFAQISCDKSSIQIAEFYHEPLLYA